MKPAVVLELDPNASALLDLLVELGHLDEDMLEAVNDRFLDLPLVGGAVTVDDVRRVVAEVVFENLDKLDDEFRRMLESEWGLLLY
jgi:hypothetical protein